MELAKDHHPCPSYYLSKGILGDENGDHQENGDGNVVENFGGYGNDIAQFGGSLLRFDQNGRFGESPFTRNIESNQKDEYLMHNGAAGASCSYASTNELPFGWLIGNENVNANTNAAMNCVQDVDRQESCMSKRPNTGESMQAAKKHCKSTTTKTQKSKGKGPQSVAAKNRRERISERMKVLQDLVPNGSKVDLVTMLEKAISYVKFLQLQVKVLATDEFWPAQGGKAPDISQVKEAIEAILATQRDRNYSSST